MTGKRKGVQVRAGKTKGMEQEVRLLLKGHMRAKGWNAADLASAMGDTEPGVRGKISRGTCSAGWLFMALHAMGVEKVTISEPAPPPLKLG